MLTMSAPPRAFTSIVSTSLRSMTTLAMLRVKRVRGPLADTSKISLITAPLKRKRVLPDLALDHVIVVARVPHEGVVAGAHQGGVIAIAAVNASSPWLPRRMSSPRPPLTVNWMRRPPGCWR